jgi:dienelactone hydrolase
MIMSHRAERHRSACFATRVAIRPFALQPRAPITQRSRLGTATSLSLLIVALFAPSLPAQAQARSEIAATGAAATVDPTRIAIADGIARGTDLIAYRLAPPGPVGDRRPAVVALHGCGGLFRTERDQAGQLGARHAAWAELLAADGYIVLMPDSFGSRGLAGQCTVQDRSITPRIRADDANRAAEWLARQPDVDPARIAILGWSNGGSTVLRAIDAGRAPSGVEWTAAIAFYPGCRPLLARDGWAPRLSVDILIGGADDWTPPAACEALAKAHAERIRLTVYPGAYHGFDAPTGSVRIRTGVTYSAAGDGRVHVGPDPTARALAIAEVRRRLASAFAR